MKTKSPNEGMGKYKREILSFLLLYSYSEFSSLAFQENGTKLIRRMHNSANFHRTFNQKIFRNQAIFKPPFCFVFLSLL